MKRRRRAEDKFQEIKLGFNNLQLQSAGSTIKNREEYIKETMIKTNVLMYVWIVGARCEIENVKNARRSDLIKKKDNLWRRSGGGD